MQGFCPFAVVSGPMVLLLYQIVLEVGSVLLEVLRKRALEGTAWSLLRRLCDEEMEADVILGLSYSLVSHAENVVSCACCRYVRFCLKMLKCLRVHFSCIITPDWCQALWLRTALAASAIAPNAEALAVHRAVTAVTASLIRFER